MNADALARYIHHIQHITAALETLTTYAEDHGGIAPDDVNWAHVGDAEHVADLLAEAVQFIHSDCEADHA